VLLLGNNISCAILELNWVETKILGYSIQQAQETSSEFLIAQNSAKSSSSDLKKKNA